MIERYERLNGRRELVGLYGETGPKDKGLVFEHTSGQVTNRDSSFYAVALVFELLSERKPVGVRARKSDASWNLRLGDLMGMQVTLPAGPLCYRLLDLLVLDYYGELAAKLGRELSRYNSSVRSVGISNLSVFTDIIPQYELITAIWGRNRLHWGGAIHWQGQGVLGRYLIP